LSLPELEKIESSFIEKAHEWLNLIKQQDSAAITRRMEQLKAKLMKTSRDYARSYEVMYKMLEAAESYTA
jgi:hypothetical protein